MKEPIASLNFSSNGASLFVGTKTGKLLVQNLRALHNPRSLKTIILSEGGDEVIGPAVQKLPESTIEPRSSVQRSSRNSSGPLTPHNTNVGSSLGPSTLKPGRLSSSQLSIKSPASSHTRRSPRRITSNASTPLSKPRRFRPMDRSPQVADLTASTIGGSRSSLDVSSASVSVTS